MALGAWGPVLRYDLLHRRCGRVCHPQERWDLPWWLILSQHSHAVWHGACVAVPSKSFTICRHDLGVL